MNVEAGSTAHFLGDFEVSEYVVSGEIITNLADGHWDGGCVWNQVCFTTSFRIERSICPRLHNNCCMSPKHKASAKAILQVILSAAPGLVILFLLHVVTDACREPDLELRAAPFS